MSLKASYCKHTLNFKFDAGTSRGVLKRRDSYFIKLYDKQDTEIYGLGEASPLNGLSIDFREDFEEKLRSVLTDINIAELELEELFTLIASENLENWPALRFALETAALDLKNGGNRLIYTNDFSLGKSSIDINGLIWMGDKDFMQEQIDLKLSSGYSTIKMKIGAIDFDSELMLLSSIRKRYSLHDLTLRVDANGAFSPSEALTKLEELAKLDIHSIEQPIRQGQVEEMAHLCRKTPVPIALDEELIGIQGLEKKKELIQAIQPQFLIFKPTLLGGLAATKEWIGLCGENKIDWWITSALESNIGLNAICQFTAGFDNPLPQGLGTGQLYYNNIPSPLEVNQGNISYMKDKNWDLSLLNF
ncbi:MAG: o-succinylbenzoate synthase [Cytophagales bacterium]|nr:o-succinylbenzoate synthase [Cytophagales bacterium]